MYSINKGIPLPKIDRSRRRKYPIEDMEVGDQLFVPGRHTKSVSAYISRITSQLPGRFRSRHCWMISTTQDGITTWKLSEEGVPDAQEGTGVWRIE